jgi:hypothetical protein
MRVILFLIFGLLPGIMAPVDLIASDTDTEPVLIYIDPVTGKYRMGSPSDAAVTTSTAKPEITGASTKLEEVSDIGYQRMIIIGIIVFSSLFLASRLIHKKILPSRSEE